MEKMYLAMESMGFVIMLILLYANAYENKQLSKKKTAFTHLLIITEVVVAADAVTWINLNWEAMRPLYIILVDLTYVLPVLMVATFSRYIYELIAEKSVTNKTPFRVILWVAIVMGVVSFGLCLSGKMFDFRDGVFCPGEAESLYYILYLVVVLCVFAAIIVNRKKLGTHDLAASLIFCLFPLLSVLISLLVPGLNLAVPFLAVDMLVIYIFLQSDQTNQLRLESNSDELTGLFNRRAYEDDMMIYPDVPPEPDFVYASIDINGLKVVNDTYGHAAGDELIAGVAACLKRTLGNYGRVYRTGGDEFVSMFFADEIHLSEVLADLKEVADEWSGNLVDSLSISIGCATKREFAKETVKEMAVIADKRMYAEKEKYYSEKGVDRRGQSEAHKVLCSLYTKILKINITTDTFSVINMNQDEQTKEKGYSEHISEWLKNFGTSGQVHPEDLEDYLAKTNVSYMREYFKRRKTSLTILYRRKFDNVFKQVMMEIIPANDYRDDNQSLFLYVKDIDI